MGYTLVERTFDHMPGEASQECGLIGISVPVTAYLYRTGEVVRHRAATLGRERMNVPGSSLTGFLGIHG